MTLLTTQGLLMRLNAMLCLKAVGKLQSSVRILLLLWAFLLGFSEPQACCNFVKLVALSNHGACGAMLSQLNQLSKETFSFLAFLPVSLKSFA